MTEKSLVKVDFKDLRLVRQKLNNIKVYQAIVTDNKKDFDANINKKALSRILEELNIDFKTLWVKCQNDLLFCKLVSKNLAINASRQGINDEKQQIDICNLISSKYGIYIKNISHLGLRPIKYEKSFNNKNRNEKRKYTNR
jgi:hypothetical protein